MTANAFKPPRKRAPAQIEIARAARYLEAERWGRGRWVYYDQGVSRWYMVTTDTLRELCVYLDDPHLGGDGYSHWCAGEPAREMPEGWAP